ncbi:MAG: metal-binding protein [Gammaproteobacteria bacterium]|nr:metal-binding protein [Gammaproteobacteria bacterium]
MNCTCIKQESLVDITRNHSAFKKNLDPVAVGNWERLMRCPVCNQLWKVDEWDKYQDLYAFKLQSAEGWEEFDSVELIKNKIIENRGGLETASCLMAGCVDKQVKGSAYCAHNLYESGTRA